MTTAEERMKILKMIQEGKITAEEGAKRMAKDIELYRKRDDIREIEAATGGNTPGDTTQRGTKDLMRMIRQGIDGSDQIEDVEIED